MHKKIDVNVVGAGIVGQVLSLRLTQAGFTVRLFDKMPLSTQIPLPEEAWLNRAVALNLESQQLLADCGIWTKDFASFCQPYTHMSVWDAESTAKIHFAAKTISTQQLGYIVPTQALSAALMQHIIQMPNLILQTGTEITAAQIETMVFENVDALWVLAGGRHESLCEHLGFEYRTWDYAQSAVVATVSVSKGDPTCAYQQFQGQCGPIALLPLPKAGWYSLVWSTRPKDADHLCQLENSTFAETLYQATLGYFGKIQCLSARHQYPLVMKHTKKYTHQPYVVVGDCAHTVHPLAGLGMNLGLKDVKVLFNYIGLARQQRRALSDSMLLKRYHQERIIEVWEVIAFLEMIKRSFAASHGGMRRLRELGMNLVNKHELVKRQLMQFAVGEVIS